MRIFKIPAALVVAIAIAAPAMFAQRPDYPTPGPRTKDGKIDFAAPPPRTADDKPDFSGSWDWNCTGPITYCGQAALKRETDTLREAIGDTPAGDAFLTSAAPASLELGRKNR
jgi:hypothetical protein